MASIIIKMALLSYKAEISALIKKGWVCGLKRLYLVNMAQYHHLNTMVARFGLPQEE